MGGNQGKVMDTMYKAIRILSRKAGPVTRMSSVYKTKAWGPVPQDDFLNKAIVLHTTLSPGLLLKALLETESYFGRKRTVKYGPRTLDLDILFYGHQIVHSSNLSIPHPELHKRRFALVPLVEIVPKFKHPILKSTMEQLLESCEDQLEVTLWK
jgi:2-amino-4-hydroxy-6-hydroxymethyldihydropteridine diphosphokinase